MLPGAKSEDAVKKEEHKKKPVFSTWARSGRRTFGPQQPPSENNLHAMLQLFLNLVSVALGLGEKKDTKADELAKKKRSWV